MLELGMRTSNHTCMILLDLLMPAMSGREFMDIVQKEEKISSIPIFIHSSVANKENTIGGAGGIKKPADLGLILTSFEGRRLHKQIRNMGWQVHTSRGRVEDDFHSG